MSFARRRVLTTLDALGFETSLIEFRWPAFVSTWRPRRPFDHRGIV